MLELVVVLHAVETARDYQAITFVTKKDPMVLCAKPNDRRISPEAVSCSLGPA